MRDIINPYIKLKEYLNYTDYTHISRLQRYCLDHDKTTLKLEIDYKLSRTEGKTGAINGINEFMYYNGDELIGYIGICHFGGDTIEVNGMVHPEFRKKGVFKRLFCLLKEEWLKRNARNMLLLSDSNFVSGQEFIKTSGACHEYSEYEMFLRSDVKKDLSLNNVTLRKACNKDAIEIARQNSIFFNVEFIEEDVRMPEDEEKRGMITYMAEVDNKIVGKVNLEISNDIGGIFGLGVIPEYRGKGYGREILLGAVEKLKERNSRAIMLQVAVKNNKALNLYKSCGFVETSTMDYFLISKL